MLAEDIDTFYAWWDVHKQHGEIHPEPGKLICMSCFTSGIVLAALEIDPSLQSHPEIMAARFSKVAADNRSKFEQGLERRLQTKGRRPARKKP